MSMSFHSDHALRSWIKHPEKLKKHIQEECYPRIRALAGKLYLWNNLFILKFYVFVLMVAICKFNNYNYFCRRWKHPSADRTRWPPPTTAGIHVDYRQIAMSDGNEMISSIREIKNSHHLIISKSSSGSKSTGKAGLPLAVLNLIISKNTGIVLFWYYQCCYCNCL
jgi:hypothetical protein